MCVTTLVQAQGIDGAILSLSNLFSLFGLLSACRKRHLNPDICRVCVDYHFATRGMAGVCDCVIYLHCINDLWTHMKHYGALFR
jgi:hypothetical protein